MNLPLKFESRMREMLKTEYDAFVSAFTAGDPAEGVRLNPLKSAGKPDFFNDPVPWCENGYYISKKEISGNHPYHLGGMLYFQEPSAMAVAEVLDIKPGDFVLDLCAAPGGKATQAGAKLEGKGLLVANEIVQSRAKILGGNIERMGIKNAVVTNESPEKLENRFKGFFDKIIVDAPCSGEGMFRKEPQAVTEWSEEHTFSCAARQKNIMDSALKMLKKGGMLVYSTCTFAPCENEGVCRYVLENYPDMELVPINCPMLCDGNGEYIGSDMDFSGTKRIFPHKNRGEGHFLALFRKKGEKEACALPKNKPSKAVEEAVKLYRSFEKDTLKIALKGEFVLFGENLYLMPLALNLDGLKIVQPGLYLGQCKKGRFEPGHALALALSPEDFKCICEFSAESSDIKKYLHGDTLEGEGKGWTAVVCDGITLGWAKASGGILKNHFPKGLRIN